MRLAVRPFLLLATSIATGVLLAACGGGDETPATPTPTLAPGTNVQRVAVRLKNFAFEPRDFAFKTGDTVEFALTSADIQHTFTVRGLPIDWSVGGGKTVTQRFTFRQPGQFRLFCDIAGHEAAGMTGAITVQ